MAQFEYDDRSIEAQISDLASEVGRVAKAITADVGGNHDETGGYVTSMTEAIMGVTAGLCKIAAAIERLASAVEDSGRS